MKHKNVYIGWGILKSMNYKRGFLVVGMVMFFLFSLFLVSAHKGPFVVQGYVYDVVTGERIEYPVVVIKHRGAIINAYTSTNLAPGNLDPNAYDDGKYDKPIFYGETDDLIIIEAFDDTSGNCRGSVSTVVSGALLNVAVGVCCDPTFPSSLVPSGPQHITEPTEIEFTWVSGGWGNTDYPDKWDVFVRPIPQVNPATSPLSRLISPLGGLPGWEVKTCNGIPGQAGKFCCESKSVGGGYENAACAEPRNLQGVYSDGVITTTWESGGEFPDRDPDGDSIHYEWKAWSVAKGDTLDSPSWAGDVNPANEAGEVAEAHLATLWQVKCCDDTGRADGCSNWVQAITPSCNKISEDCPVIYEQLGPWSGIRGKDIAAALERPLPQVDTWWKSLFWLLIRFLILMGIVLYEQERRRKRLYKKGGDFKVKHIKIKHHGFKNNK